MKVGLGVGVVMRTKEMTLAVYWLKQKNNGKLSLRSGITSSKKIC